LPLKYVYMGVNPDASNVALPTTRLIHRLKCIGGRRPNTGGPPDPNRVKPHPRSLLKRVAGSLKSSLRLLNLMAEEWFRQTLTWCYQHLGYIVLFDRHFFCDYYAHDVVSNGARRSMGRRIHGLMLKHFYPKPDLVIWLDAPAEILFARKGEGTIELLERRRGEYRLLQQVFKHFVKVDATLPEDEVTRQVADLIQDFRVRKANGL